MKNIFTFILGYIIGGYLVGNSVINLEKRCVVKNVWHCNSIYDSIN